MHVEKIAVGAADKNFLKESVILVENAGLKRLVVKFGSCGRAGGDGRAVEDGESVCRGCQKKGIQIVAWAVPKAD